MSTFRYDTKFRGATTNKGAIKLAPKFVNCPTCGFVRSKDRSKVIAKKSKQYHLFMPPNAGNEGTYYYIAYDGQPEKRFENFTGFDIICNSIESYSVKFDRSYGSDNFIIYIDNGTAPKSVNNTTDFAVVAFGTSKLVAGNIPVNPQNITITFEDGDSISFNVCSEEKIRPAKYNISFPANMLPPEASIKIVADGKNYDIKGSEGYNIYFNTIESCTAVSMENYKFPVVFILDNGTKMKSVSPEGVAEIADVPNLGSVLQMLTLDDSNITITFEDGDQLDIAIKQKFIKETLNYKLTVTNIDTSWDHPYSIEYNNGKSYVEDSIQPGETKEIEMNSLDYLRIYNRITPVPFKLEHNKGFKIKKVIGFNPEDGFTKDATDYKNTLVSDLTSDNPYIIQARSGHVRYTVYYENNDMLMFDIYISDTPVFLEVFCNTKNIKYIRYGRFNKPAEYICRTDPFSGGGVLLNNNDTLIIDQNGSEPEDIDFYIDNNEACNDNVDDIKLTLLSTDNDKVKVVHDGVYRLRIPAGEQAIVTFRVSYRITIGIQNEEYTYTFINI